MTSEPVIHDLLNSPAGLAMFEFILRWNRGAAGIPDEVNLIVVSILANLPALATDEDICEIRSRLLNIGPLIGRPAEQADMNLLARIETLIRDRDFRSKDAP